MTVRQAAIDMHSKAARKAPHARFREVHASRGKYARAEPIAALFEQDRCKLLGSFAELEDQLCQWEPLSGDESPDRLDAMVWGFTDLMLGFDQADIGMPISVPKNDSAAIGPIGIERPAPASQTPRNGMIRSARPEEIG